MKKRIIQIMLLLFLCPILITQEKTVEEIMKEEQEALKAIQDQSKAYNDKVAEDFRFFQDQITNQYEAYEKQIAKEMEELEDAIKKKWQDFRHDTKDEYVDYDKDLNARGAVNFKEGVVEVEVIELKSEPKSEEKAKARLSKKLKELTEKKGDDNKPLLQDQIKTDSKKEVTKKNVDTFVNKVITNKKIEKKEYKAKDGKTRIKYKVKIKMVPNHVEVRAKRFKNEVLKQAKRFNIRPSVAFAVMHTESCFNPKARSYIPAFGLMQLVPKSGARDAYNYIYRKDKLLKADYLYNPNNNIELGCAYLSKIRYVYFKRVENDDKAYFCTICSYNTGPGNVARALTGTTKLGSASKVVNNHNSSWVYNKLLTNLPYAETKKYLQKVTKRVEMYSSWN